MQCPECHKPYNAETIVPRILVGCGHTICEACAFDQIDEKLSVTCPECGVDSDAETVNVFPKNLALLTMKKPGIKVVRSARLAKDQLCKAHNKKIEAYCAQDKAVLCIDCILSDLHKNHEISST